MSRGTRCSRTCCSRSTRPADEPHAERLLGDGRRSTLEEQTHLRAPSAALRRARRDDPGVSRRFLLLVNPSAGGGRALERLPAVEAELARLGRGVPHRADRGTSPRPEEAARRRAAGEVVAAMGGDGLLRPLVGVLRDGSVPLAIIPGGRGNDYARVLGIPEDPAEAARIAVRGRASG